MGIINLMNLLLKFAKIKNIDKVAHYTIRYYRNNPDARTLHHSGTLAVSFFLESLELA